MANLTIQEKYNCQGYFGFGNGIAISQITSNPNYKGQGFELKNKGCDVCFIKQQCWDAHRNRVRKIFPDLCKMIDGLVEEGYTGIRLIKEVENRLKKENRFEKASEPYVSVMLGNVEDGSYVIATGKPKDRGPLTLPYPFINDEN